ncbi:M48 family metallopeptidase [Streptomyces sp. NPDC046275]|uniref:M48 family metallopeptidase n=1 Tax=Streptomyces sp. NPDC046275 TaxID=3157201 RepID=UPI0033FAA403
MSRDTSERPSRTGTKTDTHAEAGTETGTDTDAHADGRDCPDCGERVPVDPRFVTWCAACGWNVDPEGAAEEEPEPDRVERLRRGLAHRYGEQLFADLADPGAGGPGAPVTRRTGGAALLGTLLALAVHGLTAALAAAGLWLLVAGWGEGLQAVLGAFLLALAVLLRPRFGRLPKDPGELPRLERADAPELFALVDEIAASVGTRGVDLVLLDTSVNASVSTYGIRRRRLLTLGLPLWSTLEPRERIALLGHELGHYAHGDTRHGLLVHSALCSLDTWRYVLARSEDGGTLSDLLINVLTALPRWAVHGLIVLLDGATLRAAQRGEYLADGAAARVAGRDAATGLLERLLVSGSIEAALHREIVGARTRAGARARREAQADGLWERVAVAARSVPRHEYERLRRVAELRGHCVDDTHPPTHLRLRHLARAEPRPPVLVLTPARAAALDTELTAPSHRAAMLLLRDGAA